MWNKKTTKQFIEDAIKIHGNKYNYDKVVYKNSKIKVEIFCPKHNFYFKQIPNSHLRGRKCPQCANDYFYSITKTTDEFIKDAMKIHGNKYDYSLVEYKNCKTYIKIICDKHGEFIQKPNTHLNGRGCSVCKSSKGEDFIRNFLTENHINFIEQYKFKNQPRDIKYCKYDFYLNDYNAIIEYHGEQHFNFSPHFHKNFFDFLDRTNRDYKKMKFCKNNNIIFFEIHYNDNIENKLKYFCDTFKLREHP
jgi:hypothetical protein